MVLGILSIVVCQILGPIAWIMGNKDLAQINAGLMDPAGLDQTKIGRILGIIGTVFLILLTIFWVIYILFFGALIAGAAAQGNL